MIDSAIKTEDGAEIHYHDGRITRTNLETLAREWERFKGFRRGSMQFVIGAFGDIRPGDPIPLPDYPPPVIDGSDADGITED